MRAAHKTTAICKTVMMVLLALVIAVRVVAQPAILAAPDPGVMALCAGGQIVYVSIETGLPVEGEDTDLRADPCPFFGVTAFDLTPGNASPKPAPVATTLDHALAKPSVRVSGVTGQHAARAPPVGR